MINEACGSISLVEVIYGSIHWKLAKEITNLALIYLEVRKLPKQARIECEKAWTILVEDFRHQTRNELNADEGLDKEPQQGQLDSDDGLQTTHVYPDCSKHQMILNYIYGRASSILKE